MQITCTMYLLQLEAYGCYMYMYITQVAQCHIISRHIHVVSMTYTTIALYCQA